MGVANFERRASSTLSQLYFRGYRGMCIPRCGVEGPAGPSIIVAKIISPPENEIPGCGCEAHSVSWKVLLKTATCFQVAPGRLVDIY